MLETKHHIRGNLCHDHGVFVACNGTYRFNEAAHTILESKGISPHEFIKSIISVDTTKPFDGEIELNADVRGNITVTGIDVIHEPTGAKISEITRFIDFKNQTVEHVYLELDSQYQNAGVVKSIFKEALPFYDKLGIQKIELYANHDAGGYAWAKYGFKPTKSKEIDKILTHCQTKIESLMQDSPNPILQSVSKILSNKSLDVFTQIANLKTHELDKVLFKDNPKMTLSKFLLLQSEWHGEMGLSGESRKYLEQYLKA